MEAVTDTIYQMVCDFLHVTAALDVSSERRIREECAEGIQYLQTYCDPAATCEPGTACARLLCEYVLRADSGSAETFAQDFAKDLLEAQIQTQVESFAAAKGYKA